jgi:CheY-like chemotaxis protein
VTGKTLKILLVEDNSADADLIRQLLNENTKQKFDLTGLLSQAEFEAAKTKLLGL